MAFDPNKVERIYVKEWGHHGVYASDYDQLLALYREAQETIERIKEEQFNAMVERNERD